MTHDFATRAIHAGQAPDPTTGAVIPPIYQTSTFVQDGVGNYRNGYEYARGGNPTRTSLETLLADLEGATHAFSFSSGLAGEDTLLRAILKPGDRIVMGNDVYGGTHRLVNRVLVPWGIRLDTVELTDLDAVRTALADGAAVLWVETPSNPLMKISDIQVLAEIGHAAGAIVVVDNTFATPYLQQPLTLGAHVVVHSATKYLGGHSDVIGGFAATNDDELADRLRFTQNAAGAVPAPFDCYLVLRGVKTLAVRMDRHCENARAVVDLLVGHPAIDRVLYPQLPDHPGHAAAAKQMRDFGGMVSFTVKAGMTAAMTVADSTEVFTLAESLGAVESLIEHPAAMTHASAAGSPLEVPDNLVRLSVGIETVEDLLADLTQALAAR